MISTEKRLESPVVARFQDCDPFGHLNNARYIEYFLDARQDQVLEHYGIEFVNRERATSWVVSRFQIAYLRPVAALERILIRTQLIAADKRSIVVEGAFLAQSPRRLKAIAWVSFTHVDATTGRSTDHPPELTALFESVRVSGVDETLGFDSRAANMRGVLRDLGD